MTPELQVIAVGLVALAVVALGAIVVQGRTLRQLSRAMADENRRLTAGVLVSHPSHRAMLARQLVVGANEDLEVAPAAPLTRKGVTFAEGGA